MDLSLIHICTYQGMDGLKTGYTTQSMYCITVTAKRDGLRLIGVAMGEPTRDVRNSEASALLDYGFSTYGYQIEMEKGTPVTTIKVDNGKPDEVRLITKEAIGHIVAQGAQSALINTEIVLDKKKAPIQAGETVGRVILHLSLIHISKAMVSAAAANRCTGSAGCRKLPTG